MRPPACVCVCVCVCVCGRTRRGAASARCHEAADGPAESGATWGLIGLYRGSIGANNIFFKKIVFWVFFMVSYGLKMAN